MRTITVNRSAERDFYLTAEPLIRDAHTWVIQAKVMLDELVETPCDGRWNAVVPFDHLVSLNRLISEAQIAVEALRDAFEKVE